MLVLDMLPEFEKEAAKRKGAGPAGKIGSTEPIGRSVDHAGRLARVSGGSVKRAKRTQRDAPGRL